MEKSERLYHASANRSITEFVPRSDKVRDPSEGPRVFATPDKRMASIFIAGTGDRSDDSWISSGAMDNVPYIAISDKERFAKMDQGGAIYHLPNETFETDPEKGLGTLEWTSRVPVTPVEKEEHESGLETMLAHGVQVYFVDPETLANIKTAADQGLLILQSLESENQRRGINVTPLT